MSFCIRSELATIANSSAGTLWPTSLAPCLATSALLHDVMARGWSPSRHFLYHPTVRTAVRTVLLVAARVQQRRWQEQELLALAPTGAWGHAQPTGQPAAAAPGQPAAAAPGQPRPAGGGQAEVITKAKQLQQNLPQLEQMIQKFTLYVQQMQANKLKNHGTLSDNDQANLTKAETTLRTYMVQRDRINQWFQIKGIRISGGQVQFVGAAAAATPAAGPNGVAMTPQQAEAQRRKKELLETLTRQVHAMSVAERQDMLRKVNQQLQAVPREQQRAV